MRRFLQHFSTAIILLLFFCTSCIQQRKSVILLPEQHQHQNAKRNKQPPVSTYYHILMTGQSISTGAWGSDSLGGSFSDQQPYPNYMLSQPAHQPNLQGPLGTIAPLIPLVEPYFSYGINFDVETPVTGMANTMSALDHPVSPSYGVIATGHGLGAQPYAQIKKDPLVTTPPSLLRYSIGQQQISKAYQEISTNPAFSNSTYNPLGVVVIHGETDQLQGNSAFYEEYLNEFQSDYQSDMIQFLRTHNEPEITDFPMFVTQMNSRGPSQMAIAQLDASRNNKNIYLIGPTYQYTYHDKTHLKGASEYRYLGENVGKIVHKVGIEREEWEPLSPKKINFDSTLITIEFHVPVGDLVLDAPPHSTDSITGVKEFYENFGFEYIDDSYSAKIAHGGVSIGVDKKSVQISLNKLPTGSNPRIKYAAQAYASVLPSSPLGCRYGDLANGDKCYGGNLRDSDHTVPNAIDGSGRPLYNWCVSFDEPLYVDILLKAVLQGPYDPNTGLMQTKLGERGLLPLQEPYSSLGYTFVNNEEVGTIISSNVLNATGADKPIDWVLVDLLHPVNRDSIIQTQTGILQSDGDIVDPSGVSKGVRFYSLITRDYHIQIRHRNHLRVSTLRPVRINRNLGVFNFSTSVNTSYQKRFGPTRGLWAGDVDKDFIIDLNDRNLIQANSAKVGYLGTDINLDGVTNARDRALAWNNRKLPGIESIQKK